ncbi:MAG: thiamine phosphate synthase [Pseudomonadota bacterium]
MSRIDLRLYAVADPAITEPGRLVDAVQEAVAGGATLVQLRDKRDDTRARVHLARTVHAALQGRVPLIINDRVDVALVVGADGVHLGTTDMRAADARTLLGERAIIGVTVHHAHEARVAARVDYAAFGPVYPTSSKDPGDPPLGPAGLANLAAAARTHLPDLPFCAIAGIDAARTHETIAAGVDGIAVIGALFRAPDVRRAAEALRTAVDDALARKERP